MAGERCVWARRSWFCSLKHFLRSQDYSRLLRRLTGSILGHPQPSSAILNKAWFQERKAHNNCWNSTLLSTLKASCARRNIGAAISFFYQLIPPSWSYLVDPTQLILPSWSYPIDPTSWSCQLVLSAGDVGPVDPSPVSSNKRPFFINTTGSILPIISRQLARWRSHNRNERWSLSAASWTQIR